MKTNVYKRFDPRVMERGERIGINGGLPTMVACFHDVHAHVCIFTMFLKAFDKLYANAMITHT